MACDFASTSGSSGRMLGDAPERSYARKLELFSEFIEPDLRRILADLDLPSSGLVLDLGCGTGIASALLAEQAAPGVSVVGLDLSMPHLLSAREQHSLPLIQADMQDVCFRDGVFEFIWSCNTVNHAADPVGLLRTLRKSLSSDGRIAIAQSGFLPEMFFAWDAHLDDAVRAACHAYYRERYGLAPDATAAIRGLIGLIREAGFEDIASRTYTIERTQPLTEVDCAYFRYAVFEGLWGERLGPYLDANNLRKLEANCGPDSSEYCLLRPDFHHIQTLTVCTARVPVAA